MGYRDQDGGVQFLKYKVLYFNPDPVPTRHFLSSRLPIRLTYRYPGTPARPHILSPRHLHPHLAYSLALTVSVLKPSTVTITHPASSLSSPTLSLTRSLRSPRLLTICPHPAGSHPNSRVEHSRVEMSCQVSRPNVWPGRAHTSAGTLLPASTVT